MDKKVIDFDKVCRTCLSIKKDMRPLFEELIATLLMECTNIKVNYYNKI